jgi:predicted enzyme related to lactoylglutathione lyase
MKHTIVHFEVPADDVMRAKTFYAELFDWQFSSAPGLEDYWFIQAGDEDDLGGGLMKREAPGQGIVHYVYVESVADYADKAQELGGQVIVPKAPVPGMGWFALLLDPEGNTIGLWERDESAA